MANSRYAQLSTGERYDKYGFAGHYYTTSDSEGEDGGVATTQRRPKRKTLKELRASGKNTDMFTERPVTSRKDPTRERLARSYYVGIPTKRGSRPKWEAEFTGVPTRSKAGVGYWYPNHKKDDAGELVSIWYYYDQADGPLGEFRLLRYGDKFPHVGGEKDPQPFWVMRPFDEEKKKVTKDEAKTRGLDIDHPKENKHRVFGPNRLPLGFAYKTDLKVQRGRNYPRGGYRSGNSSASSAESSRANSPAPRGILKPQHVQHGVSYAQKVHHSRDSSPETKILKNLTSKLTKIEKALDRNHDKKERKPKEKQESKKPLYQQSLSGNVDPEVFFGQQGNSKMEFAAVGAAMPSRHYMQHFAFVMDGEGPPTLCIPLPPEEEMVKHLLTVFKDKIVSDWAESCIGCGTKPCTCVAKEDMEKAVEQPAVHVHEPKEQPKEQRKSESKKAVVSTPFGDAKPSELKPASHLFSDTTPATQSRSVRMSDVTEEKVL